MQRHSLQGPRLPRHRRHLHARKPPLPRASGRCLPLRSQWTRSTNQPCPVWPPAGSGAPSLPHPGLLGCPTLECWDTSLSGRKWCANNLSFTELVLPHPGVLAYSLAWQEIVRRHSIVTHLTSCPPWSALHALVLGRKWCASKLSCSSPWSAYTSIYHLSITTRVALQIMLQSKLPLSTYAMLSL